MKKQYFYIGKEEALKHQSMVYAVSEEPIPNYKKALGDNAIEYYGDNLPFYLTVVDDNTVRESTNYELYLSGAYELADGEFILNGEILNESDFPIPEDMIKPVFDYETLEWTETATDEEANVYFFEQDKEIALRIHNDHVLGINVTDEEWSEVVEYIQAVNVASVRRMKATIKRPSIFDRYEVM